MMASAIKYYNKSTLEMGQYYTWVNFGRGKIGEFGES